MDRAKKSSSSTGNTPDKNVYTEIFDFVEKPTGTSVGFFDEILRPLLHFLKRCVIMFSTYVGNVTRETHKTLLHLGKVSGRALHPQNQKHRSLMQTIPKGDTHGKTQTMPTHLHGTRLRRLYTIRDPMRRDGNTDIRRIRNDPSHRPGALHSSAVRAADGHLPDDGDGALRIGPLQDRRQHHWRQDFGDFRRELPALRRDSGLLLPAALPGHCGGWEFREHMPGFANERRTHNAYRSDL